MTQMSFIRYHLWWLSSTIILLIVLTQVLARELAANAEDKQAPVSIRNVVLIISDDQGLEMGAYGNKVIKTPNLDHLAEEGTLFMNGFAAVSSCSPSRSVIFSGLYSHTNGMYGLAHAAHNQHLLPWVNTVPSLLKKNGYATCLVGKKHILPAESLPFDEELAPEHAGKRDVEFMANEAGRFIDKHTKDPFFLVVAYSDPHRDDEGFATADQPSSERIGYSPKQIPIPRHLPDLPAVREDLTKYYEAISRLDRGVGLLENKLKQAGQLQNTLIIFLSDNGRPFPGGKTTLYDEGIHLPLVVVSPAQQQHGVHNKSMVSWVDIVPTILDWTGAKAPTEYKLPGHSLLPELDKSDTPERDRVYASHNLHEIDQYYPMRAVRTRNCKYIANLCWQLPYPLSSDISNSQTWNAIEANNGAKLGQRTLKNFFNRPPEELYDLSKDPDEIHNLVEDKTYQSTLSKMRTLLKQFQIDTHDPWYHDKQASLK